MSRIAVYCLVVVALLAATSAFHASSRWIAGPKQKLSALSESKQKFSFLEILSGKAAVAAEKRSSPTLFSTAPTKKVAAKKMGKISALAQEAIAIYKKCYPAPKAGGSMDLDDNAIAFCFGELTRFTKDEKATLEMVKNAPSILQKDLARSKDNFGKSPLSR
ncbi:hypothetical protein B484DRAFT_408626 [Ochromonadaceae sp. CCMP2298]|nr:hypothetical protein B484DRAFT_408626 [Ochromonadaceae sp. CCMP2298]